MSYALSLNRSLVLSLYFSEQWVPLKVITVNIIIRLMRFTNPKLLCYAKCMSLIVIIWLMLSVMGGPKVIPFSGIYCNKKTFDIETFKNHQNTLGR